MPRKDFVLNESFCELMCLLKFSGYDSNVVFLTKTLLYYRLSSISESSYLVTIPMNGRAIYNVFITPSIYLVADIITTK